MRSLVVAFVLGWLSLAPAWASPPQVPAARAPARPVATTRWMWMTGMGGPFLVFYYVDQMAGPSAKGGLFNHKGTIELTALDPKHLPKVKGRPVAKGTLSVGGSIEIGDRVFAIAGDNRHSVLDTPMPICPEARIKAASDAKRAKKAPR